MGGWGEHKEELTTSLRHRKNSSGGTNPLQELVFLVDMLYIYFLLGVLAKCKMLHP